MSIKHFPHFYLLFIVCEKRHNQYLTFQVMKALENMPGNGKNLTQ